MNMKIRTLFSTAISLFFLAAVVAGLGELSFFLGGLPDFVFALGVLSSEVLLLAASSAITRFSVLSSELSPDSS